jgi:hypothetical protein
MHVIAQSLANGSGVDRTVLWIPQRPIEGRLDMPMNARRISLFLATL